MKSFIRNLALFIAICSFGLTAHAEAKSKHKEKEQCEKDCLTKCEKREQRYQKKLEKKEAKHKEKAEKKERRKEKESPVVVIQPSDTAIIIETPKVEIDQAVVVGERKPE